MRPAMYIFVNEGLQMSAGKIAAQAAHAAVEAYRLSCDEAGLGLVDEWYKGGHYTKLVMAAPDIDYLWAAREYVRARGFRSYLVIDEGHTEIPAITPTALGVEIVDRDDPHTSATFSSFKTLKAPRPAATIESASVWERLRGKDIYVRKPLKG